MAFCKHKPVIVLECFILLLLGSEKMQTLLSHRSLSQELSRCRWDVLRYWVGVATKGVRPITAACTFNYCRCFCFYCLYYYFLITITIVSLLA